MRLSIQVELDYHFSEAVDVLLRCGAIPEPTFLWWDVRPQPRFGNLVAPGLYGPHHQHFFNVRLDMQVDGDGNSPAYG